MNILSRLKHIAKNRDCILALGWVCGTKAALIRQIQAWCCPGNVGATLAKASWPMTAGCSTVPSVLPMLPINMFSANIASTSLGNSAHKIGKAFRNAAWQSHTYFTSYKSAKYKCKISEKRTLCLTHRTCSCRWFSINTSQLEQLHTGFIKSNLKCVTIWWYSEVELPAAVSIKTQDGAKFNQFLQNIFDFKILLQLGNVALIWWKILTHSSHYLSSSLKTELLSQHGLLAPAWVVSLGFSICFKTGRRFHSHMRKKVAIFLQFCMRKWNCTDTTAMQVFTGIWSFLWY